MIRTRFAPSPTGHLHIGGLRTALYAYLFARNQNGHFILRIEDTDQNRFVEGATEHLIEILHEFGITPDEGPKSGGDHGPYIQSERAKLHQEAAEELLKKGAAYRCFCTAERLDEMRESQRAAKKAPMYDRHCLKLSEQEIQEALDAGTPHVIRLKVPYDKPIKFKDHVRGNVTFDSHLIDDQILLKSDGFPTYHLANVVDDHHMQITHVTRAEEWLPSTPKHILIYEAFGWKPPEFAHLPLILNKDKTKLSKRQNDVNVESYLEKGYLKEAILNFIAFLGWHPGGGEETEIFDLDELIQKFDLEKVHKSGAIFDLEKLDWFNWQWRRRNFLEKIRLHAKNLDPNVTIQEVKKGHEIFIFQNPDNLPKLLQEKSQLLLEQCEKWLDPKYKSNPQLLHKSLLTVEDKILKDPKDINEYIAFYFNLPEYNAEMLTHEKMKIDNELSRKTLSGSAAVIEELEENEISQPAIVKDKFVAYIKSENLKNGQVLWPLRAALSGQEQSPGAFDIITALGKEESLNRIQKAIDKL